MYRAVRRWVLKIQLWWLQQQVDALERRFSLNEVNRVHELKRMELERRHREEDFEHELVRTKLRFEHNSEMLEARVAHRRAILTAELECLSNEREQDSDGYYGRIVSEPRKDGMVDVIFSGPECNCDFNPITPCPLHGTLYKFLDAEQILPSRPIGRNHGKREGSSQGQEHSDHEVGRSPC